MLYAWYGNRPSAWASNVSRFPFVYLFIDSSCGLLWSSCCVLGIMIKTGKKIWIMNVCSIYETTEIKRQYIKAVKNSADVVWRT